MAIDSKKLLFLLCHFQKLASKNVEKKVQCLMQALLHSKAQSLGSENKQLALSGRLTTASLQLKPITRLAALAQVVTNKQHFAALYKLPSVHTDKIK